MCPRGECDGMSWGAQKLRHQRSDVTSMSPQNPTRRQDLEARVRETRGQVDGDGVRVGVIALLTDDKHRRGNGSQRGAVAQRSLHR